MPKTDNKKTVILETAMQLFATHGYASTPISLIAKTAGVSQGLMYNFFPGKKDLLREMIMMGSVDIGNSMEAYQKIKDPNEAIRTHVRLTIKIIQQKKEFWRLLHAIRLQGGVIQEVEDIFESIVSRVTIVFEKIFRKLEFSQPKLEALLFLTQIDGLVILYLQNNKIPIVKLGEQLIKRYE